MKLDEMTIDIQQDVVVNAGPEEVFKGVLHRFGEGNTGPNGESLNLRIEPFAGGRWFRDRGQGIQHLWGHVQVIKPHELIELSGPMFMSYPAINHIEIKLTPVDDGTKVSLRHRAVGMIAPEHREGVHEGWKYMLDNLVSDFARTAGSSG